LIGRFSGRVLRSGEHIVPEAALEALADQNIPFAVRGRATDEIIRWIPSLTHEESRILEALYDDFLRIDDDIDH
jgi:hypothetical protein